MKRFFTAMLCLAMVLTGCGAPISPEKVPQESSELTASPTLPLPGDPDSVACKSSYSGQADPGAIVARVGNATVSNRELQLWYLAEAAQYRTAETAPDFNLPLDTQACTLDGFSGSWQQYFLQQALSRWHTVQALTLHSEECPLPQEDAHRPDPDKLQKYMDGMPAAQFLYRYNTYFQPNSQHQAWLDGLPDTLQPLTSGMSEEKAAELLEFARELNYAYMYFTTLSYDLEEITSEGTGDTRVSFRQILLTKDDGKTLSECLGEARELLAQWSGGRTPSADSFAQLAALSSRDEGSLQNGGLYRNVLREQLPEEIAQWCFDPARREGDTTILTLEDSVHILYFLNCEQTLPARSSQAQAALLAQLREEYPMEVSYSAISLTGEDITFSLSDLLYPDIAHQRLPEIPLYLQQSYAGTMYGNYKLTTNGCGITSLAMLASYMTDSELTPAALANRYGSYSGINGTDGSLFSDAPPQLGFYLIKKTYDVYEARAYLEQGYPLVVLQHKGYWTSGGHYLVLESITEDGMVQIRDSNMYNYVKLPRHQDDQFPWDSLTGACQGFWIYEKKAVITPACTRCGDPESLPVTTVTDYLCEKCKTALLRRNTFLNPL